MPVSRSRQSQSQSQSPSQPADEKRSQPPQQHGAAPARSILSRVIREANSFVTSFRDGLTPSEREDRRRVGERKQILDLHMKTVSRTAHAAAS